MDRKIILFAIGIIIAGRMNGSIEPVHAIDEPRSWKSFDEVLKVYLALPESSDSELYTYKTPQAIRFGLRSAERILDTVKLLGLSGKSAASALETTLISNRSIREIALLGIMMSLSETRNVPSAGEIDWARRRYKTKEVGDDVLEHRRRALEALDVLSGRNP